MLLFTYGKNFNTSKLQIKKSTINRFFLLSYNNYMQYMNGYRYTNNYWNNQQGSAFEHLENVQYIPNYYVNFFY